MNTRRILSTCAMTAVLLFAASANALPEQTTAGGTCQGANCGTQAPASVKGHESRATPEPTTIALLAIGLIGLGLARRKAS